MLSWRDVKKILRKAKFYQTRQTGSHVFLTDGIHKVTIPRHHEIKKRNPSLNNYTVGLYKRRIF
ncbi:MAG: addiction module toxin, HicA family [Nitrosopumilaceae archaeon]|nr:type II toxin-antitoxin system HicA family toxin [Nitrosopumilaceae archaeon]NIU00231.1 type II toxin-antitoxin system HicA family toxin [Nitrosopumilaceae archaeon]NIU86643.1 addiction module toxin, HicA family [Nitrosopumilaceae archaeon]NIV65338.1 addiction module toxin, HicA family [Nitrosopumilaceae archaeon]NIX60833.1 addiction module toxin, HicA family [Nitrosopumilaceae archaeon]